jgi:Domain of unknown function (DUF5134)
MSGPSWLAGTLAALMLAVAAVAAGRLCWRLRAGRAEADADALHVLTGVAMAGMFEPGLGSAPAAAWQAVFTATAAWFTWQSIRRRGGTVTAARQSHPGAHVVECGAMLYVLWPAATGGTGMSGMAEHAGAISGNPAIALVLAVGMLGYLVRATDQVLSRQRRGRASVELSAVLASDADPGHDGGTAPARQAGPRGANPAGQVLAPRLAACQTITMGLAMGYMLVTML